MASTSLPETNESPRIQHSVEEGLWRREAEKEQARMLELLGGEMRSKNGKSRHHPIYNFIFEYYMFKPKMLLQYSPGLGVRLEGAQPGDPALSSRGFSHDSWGAWADPSLAKNKTVESLRWTRDLLKTTVDRKPELHCYGLHEWAMLYHPAESKEKPPHKFVFLFLFSPILLHTPRLYNNLDHYCAIRISVHSPACISRDSE
eukprot:1326085-Amorphochlora_amoeboformis.AAC.2